MKRRCFYCGRMTPDWQRVNGGPWHCYACAKNQKDYRDLLASLKSKDETQAAP